MVDLTGKRLVVFGCGYVGTAVARAAAGAGVHVTALTRNPATAAGLRHAGVDEVVVADLSGTDWHRRIRLDPEMVVNCVSAGGGGIDGYRQSYVEGMRSVLDWAAGGSRGVGTLVYTSSTSVYPQGGGEAVDETSPVSASTVTGGLLIESENLLRRAPAHLCQRWFVLRLAGIYGPGRHLLLDQMRAGARTLAGSETTRLNLAHRDDIVAALLACLGAPAAIGREVFNVADGRPAPRGEVVRWLAARLGCGVPRFDDAAPSARRGGQPALDRIIDSTRLQERLGWRPRFADFRAGFEAILTEEGTAGASP